MTSPGPVEHVPAAPPASGTPKASPAMPPAVVDCLASELAHARTYVEYGAGGSTMLAAQTGVRDIITVESDRAFLRRVERDVRAVGAQDSRFHPLHADIGPTGAWGRPSGTEAFERWHGYAQAGVGRAVDLGLSPDLVLIDGRFRVACFLATLFVVEPGTVIMFDDYTVRSKYAVVEEFGAPEGYVDRLAYFRAPASFDVRRAAFVLAAYSTRPAS